MTRIRLMGSTALLSLAVVLAANPALAAPKKADAPALPEVVVTADRPTTAPEAEGGLSRPLAAFTLTGAPLVGASVATPDTATMLTAVPGVQTATGGGVSGLPVMRGLADDRVNVLTMGMAITSACGNHMNPALSYVDPGSIGKVEVLSGVTPVSKGGDSIAGSIIVSPKAPQFSTTDALAVHGRVSAFARSNGHALGGALAASVANRDWFVEYTGSWSRAGNYRGGGDALVKSSAYVALNHGVTLARRLEVGLFTLSAGIQNIPFQGFPNVRMDLLGNSAHFVNAKFEGAFDWGRLEATAFAQHTEHYMNFMADKSGNMPMNTVGNDAGWSVKATVDLSARDRITFGNELRLTTLDEWWRPTMAMISGMGNETYVNVNGGRRTRLGTFAEWERSWSNEWSTLIGLRNDTVWTDAGSVKGYNSTMPAACVPNPNAPTCMWHYADDAAAFNGRGHLKTDVNFDVTALARWKPNATFDGEFGYARKTRSPNFYERYAWSTSGMSASMISWFGDANGYVGDIDLKPEVANTVSATFRFHDAAKAWELQVTPWVNYVENFIDADRTAAQPGMFQTNQPQFVLLRFANHDALLYGFDASGRAEVARSIDWGSLDLSGRMSYTRGRNLDGGDLYRIMPLETRIGLDHRLGGWSNRLELQMVAAKTAVDADRNEMRTPGYALLNWKSGYEWSNVRIDVGVDNVLDQKYLLPLGGVDWTDFKTNPAPSATRTVNGVAGPGRSFWLGASAKF